MWPHPPCTVLAAFCQGLDWKETSFLGFGWGKERHQELGKDLARIPTSNEHDKLRGAKMHQRTLLSFSPLELRRIPASVPVDPRKMLLHTAHAEACVCARPRQGQTHTSQLNGRFWRQRPAPAARLPERLSVQKINVRLLNLESSSQSLLCLFLDNSVSFSVSLYILIMYLCVCPYIYMCVYLWGIVLSGARVES